MRWLARRGLRGVKLVISDAHEGIKAAVSKVMHATWQRCRVHFMRNVSAHAGKSARRVVTAFMSAAFAQDTADAAKGQWRKVADQVRPSLPKLAGLLDEAETDVLAYMTFPPAHRAKLHSTNPLERLNGEIKRRTEVVGIFPNEAAIAPPTMLPPAAPGGTMRGGPLLLLSGSGLALPGGRGGALAPGILNTTSTSPQSISIRRTRARIMSGAPDHQAIRPGGRLPGAAQATDRGAYLCVAAAMPPSFQGP